MVITRRPSSACSIFFTSNPSSLARRRSCFSKRALHLLAVSGFLLFHVGDAVTHGCAAVTWVGNLRLAVVGVKVMSATHHEAPYVLDGLLHHGTLLRIDTHYTDTGGGASDHVFILCALLGFRFCPRLRDLPERKLACIAPSSTYSHLQPLLGSGSRPRSSGNIGARYYAWSHR